ncbi:peptidylprolyl isomerase [Prochlorococcus sp. MIT 1201]|uniref:peptidylprolyl isomerase n=1 Tax=Prochlorococcus sp. MIT 1201 TaxID=3082535 RepID=UPI0039A49500
MSTEHVLLTELQRYNLLIPLLKSRITEEAVGNEQPPSEDLEKARAQFFQQNKLNDPEAVQGFLKQQGWSEEDLDWQIALPLRTKAHCRNHYRHKAEAHFLNRKNQLDRVVYSLLRTKDLFLARELYLRIDGGEADFGDLASQFAEGPERNTKGVIGPVPMTQAHPTLAETLRTAKPGVLMHPIRIGEWWLVIRLESYTPATFNDDMADHLSLELFNQWVNEESARRIKTLKDLGVAPTAE